MAHSDSPKDPIQHALRELTAARDEVRLRMHLLSLEARQRWGELESKLLFFQDQASEGGERVAEAASMKARELTRAVREFMDNAAGKLDLAVTAQDVMTRGVQTCSVGNSLSDAAKIMWDGNFGSVPVINSEGKLCGIITDRDICMAAYTRGQPLSTVGVETAMSHRVFSASPSDTLEQVLNLMKERQVRRVPITQEDGRLAGIISLADVARYGHSRGQDPMSSSVVVSALAGISLESKDSTREGSVAA